jgi:hypothetical protein
MRTKTSSIFSSFLLKKIGFGGNADPFRQLSKNLASLRVDRPLETLDL